MKRREYLTDLAIATTAPLVGRSADQATEDLTSESSVDMPDMEYCDRLNAGPREIFRRGEWGEILVSRDKPDEVENSYVKAINQQSRELIDEIPIYEDTPVSHIGDHNTIVYTYHREQKYSYFLPYYPSESRYGTSYAVQGWVSKDE